jgi:hypothetical protein
MSLFENHSLDDVISVIEDNVSFYFEDAYEIGSSDVSCCVRSVVDQLGLDFDSLSKVDIMLLRNGVQNAICELEGVI